MKILTAIFAIIGMTSAYAADAAVPAGAQQGGLLSMLPLFLILILFMYFMIIRPQTKRAKDQKNLIGNLKKDDEVITSGGIAGTITKIGTDFICLNIAEGVSITIQKNAIISCIPKGTIKSVE